MARKASKKEKCKYCPNSFVDLAGHVQRKHADKIQHEATDDANNKSRRPRKLTYNQMKNIIDTSTTSTDASEHSEHEAEISRLNAIISSLQLQVQNCVATNTRYKKNDDAEKNKIQELTAQNRDLIATLADLQQRNYQMESTLAAQQSEHEAEISRLNAIISSLQLQVRDCVATNTRYKKNDDAEKNKIQELTAQNRDLIATLADLQQRNYQMESTLAAQQSEHEAEISRLNAIISSLQLQVRDCVATNTRYKKNDDAEKNKIQELTAQNRDLIATLADLQQRNYQMESTLAAQQSEHEAEISRLNAIISSLQLQVRDCVATNTRYKKNDDAEKNKIQELTAQNRDLIATLADLQQRNYQMESTLAAQQSEHEAEISRLNAIISSLQLQVRDCVATNTRYKKNDDAEKNKIQELTAQNRDLIATLADLQQRNYQMESTLAAQRSEHEAEISDLNVSLKTAVKELADLKQSTDASINRLTKSNTELQNLIKQMEKEIKRLSSGVDAVEEKSFTDSGVSVKMQDVVVDSRIDYKLLSQKILKVKTCEDMPTENSNVWVADGKYITLKKSYQIFLEKELFCRENNVSTLLEYVYGCNLRKLLLINQEICFKGYQKLLASKRIEEIEFRRVQVMGENDELLRIDDILKGIPNIHKFVYEFRDDEFKDRNAAHETSIKLGKLQPFPNLRICCIYNIQDDFYREIFRKFFDKNPAVDFYPPKCVLGTPKVE